uniref:SYO1-like TPR repeats domain-containing protein n=1 Tax=Amblyomma maculatum TaxID=34609 RepID=G3MNT1_AMBMU
MGKAKTKKRASRRNNPTGMPSTRDIEGSELQDGNVTCSVVDNLPYLLQSGTAEERHNAACVMANISKDSATCRSLLKASIIRTAAPLLLDKNCAVRHSIVGSLRNISAINYKACEELVKFDIMTPLVCLLEEYKSPWEPVESQGKIDSKTEIFYEAVNLLWNLCENSATCVSVFNRERLWMVLLPCLNADKFGTKIATAVGCCLYTASEDNAELAQCMIDFKASLDIFQTLSEDPGIILLQVLSAGILVNITEVQKEPLAAALLPIIPVLSNALSLPVFDNIKTLAAKVELLEQNVDMLTVEEKERNIEQILASVLDGLMAKQTALEILYNIVCEEDGGTEEEDCECASDDSSEVFDDDMETEESSDVHPLNISCELHKALVENYIAPEVLDHVSELDKTISKVLLRHKPSSVVLKRVHSVRCRALLCLGNLADTLNPAAFGGISGLASTWTCLASLLFHNIDSKELDLLEASTSACRSVLQALASAATRGEASNTRYLPNVTDEELEVLAQVGLQCSELHVRTIMTRIMATLACLLGPQRTDVLKRVGQYLLEVCVKDTDIRVVTEALDATFDVFAEDTTDAVAAEIGLVTKLRQMLPAFKSKVNEAKKTLVHHYPVIATIKTNLVRFIEYKAQRPLNSCGGDIG